MLRRMRIARAHTAPLATLALLATACWIGDSRSVLGARSFREVSATEGRRLLERPGAVLVQPLVTQKPGRIVRGAERIREGAPLPLPVDGAAAPVVVVAADVDAGFRAAARLARAGIEEVAVVRGGVAAWETARPRIEAASAAKPRAQ